MTAIHVLVPSFNCRQWIGRCLQSVMEQAYAPAQVLLIDDASTDAGYGHLAELMCRVANLWARNSGLGTMYRYHRNDENRKCPYNLRLGIDLLGPGPDDVIFLLDGDDFLPHGQVLSRIAEVYEDQATWLTYGNYVPYPENTGQTLATAFPPEVIEARSFRTHPTTCFNHPLTFRKFLWDEVSDADLQNDAGEWFRGGYDWVIMAPMLEMAAPDHFRFLDEVLYCYNAVNPASDALVHEHLVAESRQVHGRRMKPRLARC